MRWSRRRQPKRASFGSAAARLSANVSSQNMAPELSKKTLNYLAIMFEGEDRELAAQLLLEQCGNNLPGLENGDAVQLERFRFAALKVSGGQLAKLERAVQLAQTDWRDLLVLAGFAEDLKAHETWTPGTKQS